MTETLILVTVLLYAAGGFVTFILTGVALHRSPVFWFGSVILWPMFWAYAILMMAFLNVLQWLHTGDDT